MDLEIKAALTVHVSDGDIRDAAIEAYGQKRKLFDPMDHINSNKEFQSYIEGFMSGVKFVEKYVKEKHDAEQR